MRWMVNDTLRHPLLQCVLWNEIIILASFVGNFYFDLYRCAHRHHFICNQRRANCRKQKFICWLKLHATNRFFRGIRHCFLRCQRCRRQSPWTCSLWSDSDQWQYKYSTSSWMGSLIQCRYRRTEQSTVQANSLLLNPHQLTPPCTWRSQQKLALYTYTMYLNSVLI